VCLPRDRKLGYIPAFAMATGSKVIYEFGPFRVDPDKQVLSCEDRLVPLAPKAFETLLILLRHSREVVSKDELMKAVWPDAFVEEANLSQNIFVLRKALGDTPEDKRYIVTHPGRGYRFASDVRTVTQDGEDVVIASRSRAEMVVEEDEGAAREGSSALLMKTERRFDWKYFAAIAGLVVLLMAGAVLFLRKHTGDGVANGLATGLGKTDSVLVADFTNTTGDALFDGTLREGLAVQLEQSPYLRLVSEDRVQEGLRLMGQSRDARLAPEIARELCQRTQSSAVLQEAIAQIGTQYLLTVKAVDCMSGESLASAQAQASDKNHVLDALGKTSSEIRNKLGESLSTVREFDRPLEQASTASLEALKAFSSGVRVQSTSGDGSSIPFYKHAIEIDPNFALAYARLGIAFTSIGEPSVAAGYTAKAYELRERASEPENYFISAIFYKEVTGNLEKAEQSCKLWMQAYPRAEMPHVYLAGAIYPVLGKYEQAVAEASEAVRLKPDYATSYAFLMFNYTSLNRLDEANAAHEKALERKLDNDFYPLALYQIAFLQNDAAGMAQQVSRSVGQPGIEDELLGMEADTAAYAGRLKDARAFSRQAMDSAERSGQQEAAATHIALSALREALFGNVDEARRRATLALGRSNGRDVQYGAALALAYVGDDARAQALASDLSEKYAEDAIVQFNYLPALRAKLAVARGKGNDGIEILRAATPYELGQTTESAYGWTALYPIFVRGEAYMAAHQAGEAVAEFQKILDHRGIALNLPISTLANVGLARAYVLTGDTVKARAAYEEFFTLWKDADRDIPIFKQARAEYLKLQKMQ